MGKEEEEEEEEEKEEEGGKCGKWREDLLPRVLGY